MGIWTEIKPKVKREHPWHFAPNLGLLLLGFLVYLIFDYFFVMAGSPMDPNSLWQKSEFLCLLFPVAVFGVNMYLRRDVAIIQRYLICLWLAFMWTVIELVLITKFELPFFHLAFGGT